MNAIEQAYDNIRRDAQQEESILGFVLTGSRGRGFENQWSDYDFAIFVEDAALDHYQQRYANLPSGAHLYIFTLDSFRQRAVWGSADAWERYTWAHLNVDYDRTGSEIQRLLDEKGRIPEAHVDDYLFHSLNHFLNQPYHSLKALRVGDTVGHRLEGAEMIRPFLQAVFAIHDRRIVPYYKYLRWEMETYPLHKLTLSVDELLACFYQILENGAYQAQQQLVHEAKAVFTNEGYGEMFEQYRARLVLNYPTPVD